MTQDSSSNSNSVRKRQRILVIGGCLSIASVNAAVHAVLEQQGYDSEIIDCDEYARNDGLGIQQACTPWAPPPVDPPILISPYLWIGVLEWHRTPVSIPLDRPYGLGTVPRPPGGR